MKTIKTYLNAAEAGFASSLLEAGGIRTLLKGEESFAVTPGFASGGIQLQVPDEDFEKALILLREGFDAADDTADTTEEASDFAEEIPAEEFETQVPAPDQRQTGKIPVGVFVAALVVLGFLSFALYQRSEEHAPARPSFTTTADLDGDGQPDHFYFFRYGTLQREEVDRNGDRAVDAWTFFGSGGYTERWEGDDNFDTRPDIWYVYRHGKQESWKRDVDFDGVPDVFATCENGQTVESEVRPGDSKIVLRRFHFAHENLRDELVDEDRDGRFDYKIVYDVYGTPSERMPIDRAKEP